MTYIICLICFILVMAKREQSSVIKYHERDKFYMVAYGKGELVSDACIGDHFFEQLYTDMIIKLFKQSTMINPWFLDVGANIGIHSLAVASHGIKVIAIEGNKENAVKLRLSKAINKFNEMTIINRIVLDKPGLACIKTRPENMGGISVKYDCEIYSNVTTIDMILGWHAPYIMKMDIEGSEYQALLGAHDILKSGLVKYILIELTLSFNTTLHAVDLLISYGYTMARYDLQDSWDQKEPFMKWYWRAKTDVVGTFMAYHNRLKLSSG